MSLEPEKPIEGLLRRFARKRRERAGDSWQIPPTTRRLLQQEVARKLARNKATSGSWLHQLISLDWFPPIAATTCVAVMIMGVWLFWGRQGDHGTKSAISSTSSAGSSASGLVQLAANDKDSISKSESANTLEKAKEVAVSETSKDQLENRKSPEALQSPAPGENRSRLSKTDTETPAASLDIANRIDQPNAGLGVNMTRSAPPQDSLTPNSSAAAAGIAAPLRLTPELARQTEKRSLLANEPLAFKAAAAGPSAGAKDTVELSKTNLVDFGLFAGSQAVDLETTGQKPLARGLLPSASRFARSQKIETIKRVLTSFHVEQAGRELRVIDSDGSIYAGPILSSNRAASVTPLSAAVLDDNQSKVKAGTGDTAANPETLTPHSVFELIGTNKSLNRRLVFSGILSTNQNFISRQSNARTGLGMNGALNGVQTNQQLNYLHLSGTVVIEGEQPIRIEAGPAVR